MIADRWGVTDDEVVRRYPCDELVPAPVLQLWRGVTVDAAPAEVWPWVCQVRLAPYSYDWLDNLGRRSPRTVVGLPEPRPGEPFTCVGGRFRVGRVLSVEPQVHVTGRILQTLISYVLVPSGSGTRLLMKLVQGSGRWYAPALAVGDWPMARRQLLNLKALAESRPAPSR